jgi:hypothetical protein
LRLRFVPADEAVRALRGHGDFSPAGMKDPDGPGQDIRPKEANMIRLTFTFTCTVQAPDISGAILLALLAIDDDRQERARKKRRKRLAETAVSSPRPKGLRPF